MIYSYLFLLTKMVMFQMGAKLFRLYFAVEKFQKKIQKLGK